MALRRGGAAGAKAAASTFEPVTSLSDAEKESLARELLAEFGVTRILRKTDKGELIHSCCLPGNRHKNGDAAASASLNYRKLVYKCYGCGGKGGLLWLIAICREQDSDEAREWLAGATGTGGQVMDLSRLLELLEALEAKPESRAPIPSYDPSMLDDWDFIHPYMTEIRRVPEATLDHFRVGYAREYPMGRHAEPQERITIPLFWRGELVGWQARALFPGDEPKYKNSPEFPRERVLYNDHDGETVVLVESPLSVLRHFHHVPEFTATFGASVADSQLRVLQRHRKIVIWFDNDNAGWEATEHVADELTPYCQVWAVDSPWAADPGDMDDATVRKMIIEAVPFPVWERPRKLHPWKD
jgi:hypothetical protein